MPRYNVSFYKNGKGHDSAIEYAQNKTELKNRLIKLGYTKIKIEIYNNKIDMKNTQGCGKVENMDYYDHTILRICQALNIKTCGLCKNFTSFPMHYCLEPSIESCVTIDGGHCDLFEWRSINTTATSNTQNTNSKT